MKPYHTLKSFDFSKRSHVFTGKYFNKIDYTDETIPLQIFKDLSKKIKV